MTNPNNELPKSSLTKRILKQIGIRIAIVISLSALVSYFHIFALLEEQVQDSLQKYISERGQKESAIFTNAENHHLKLKQEFLDLWVGEKAYSEERFAQFFMPQPDGTVRLSKAAFDGYLRPDGTHSQHLSAYVGVDAPMEDDAFKRRLLLSYDLLDRFAPSFTVHSYSNLYISMPENVNIVYWPGIRWGSQADAELDVNTEEWVYVANSENNPTRESVWTGLYYDQTADEWMVSVETPVDYEGQHLANLGHDILLNTLFERVFNDNLEGTYNFLFREDGRIIAHPQLVDKLHDAGGILQVEATGMPDLINMVELIRNESYENLPGAIIEDSQSNSLLAITRIKGPDWYFVTVYPKGLLVSTALSIAYIVGIIGLVSLVVELLIFFRVIHFQVLEPLHVFWRFTNRVTKRDFEALQSSEIKLIKHRKDEMGELANAMDDMATKIYRYESELEERVDEQTREVQKTNLKLQQESSEKARIVSLLQTIARDVSGLQGNEYFNTMSSFMAESLEADFVLICRTNQANQTIESLSACLHNTIIDNIEYQISGTPCEVVLKEGPQMFDGNAKELFPTDQDLFDLDLDSYIGTPMFDSNKCCIGHLAVMKKGTFEAPEMVKLVVDSVSSRASSELLRQVNEELILYQASTDSLTGLLNRAALMENLKRLIAHADRGGYKLAVAFIDLDNFKPINDRYGHSIGDEVLRELGVRLRRCARDNELVGRLGGDEFVIALDLQKEVNASVTAIENIRREIIQDFKMDNLSLPMSCSIGIAVYPDDGETCDSLINNADRAMYQAKELGKNRIQFFTAEMNSQLEYHQQIEFDLRQAVADEQFKVYYQPQICLETQKIVKFEALVRWQHPQNGQVQPGEFISIAEKTGQIIDIGDFVLRQVGMDYPHLKQAYAKMEAVAVNFSARQFSDSKIVSRLSDMTESGQLQQDHIDIEITESVFIDAEDSDVLKRFYLLRDLGFKIALDDFGTGYSSLAYLKQFPVDILKIDRSFIHDLTSNVQSRALVSSIIDLAQHFHLNVVAEGIENEEQQDILRYLGCDLGQGFLYAKPMALEHLLQPSTVIRTL